MKKNILVVLLCIICMFHANSGGILNFPKPSGRVFILSIGINTSSLHNQLQNCVSDAIMVSDSISCNYIAGLFELDKLIDNGSINDREQYTYTYYSSGDLDYYKDSILYSEGNLPDEVTDTVKLIYQRLKQWNKLQDIGIYQYLVLEENATNENIKKCIEDIAREATPEDYFFLYFAGFTYRIELDDKSTETALILYSNSQTFDEKDYLLLPLLNRWLEAINCKWQMIITEAGYGNEFGYDLVASLSPAEFAYISENERERIVLTTSGLGYDSFWLSSKNGRSIECEHGPLSYYFANTKKMFRVSYSSIMLEPNLFAITESTESIDTLSDRFYNYSRIFYEKELLSFLKRYLVKNPGSRGTGSYYYDEANPDTSVSKKIALVIGTNKYQGKPSWKDLANPINDATSISKLLKNKFGYDVILLQNVTKDSILTTLINNKRAMSNKDEFILFIAGHGYFDHNLGDGFIVTMDSKTIEDDEFKNSYLQFAPLNKLLDGFPSEKIFVILDICFGGSFGNINKDINYIDYSDELADISIAELQERKKDNKSRVFLASGMAEVPDYWNKSSDHSPFANKLIKILEDDEPYLTPGYIYKKLERNITEPMLKEFGSNDPKGEFFLYPNNID